MDPSKAINVCTQFAIVPKYDRNELWRLDAFLGDTINKTTEPETFVKSMKEFPEDVLEYRGFSVLTHPLGRAACVGNKVLSEYILTTLNKKHLLKIGGSSGWTPLFNAVINKHYDICELFLKFKADPNLATSEEMAGYPIFSTPLWVAVEKTHNQAIIQLLLKHGASANVPFTTKGLQNLQEATQQLLDSNDDDFLVLLNLPDKFRCPITTEIMTEPVLCSDGHTYERKTIVEWLTKQGKSPLTLQNMDVTSIVNDEGIIEEIKQWRLGVLESISK